jgi:hypothetical protein
MTWLEAKDMEAFSEAVPVRGRPHCGLSDQLRNLRGAEQGQDARRLTPISLMLFSFSASIIGK